MTLFKRQLNLLLFFSIAFGITLSSILGFTKLQNVFATTQSSVVKDTDTDFSQGTLTNTAVSGTGAAAYVKLAGNSSGGTWYNSSWTYRKQLTINNSAQSSILTNFPVMVKLTSSNFDFTKAQSLGQDLRFADSDGTTLLSYEIEKWDNIGQQAIVFVKIPSIAASSSSGIFICTMEMALHPMLKQALAFGTAILKLYTI